LFSEVRCQKITASATLSIKYTHTHVTHMSWFTNSIFHRGNTWCQCVWFFHTEYHEYAINKCLAKTWNKLHYISCSICSLLCMYCLIQTCKSVVKVFSEISLQNQGCDIWIRDVHIQNEKDIFQICQWDRSVKNAEV
jgi:hypothetical protein